MAPVFTYFCRTQNGNEFNFRTSALLDLGITVKNDDGVPGEIVDMVAEFPQVSAAELHYDYELARAMSM